MLGASWEAGESWEWAGASWSQGSKLGGWRELGASSGELWGWRELGASWSEGSDLGGRGAYQNWWVHCSLCQHVVGTPKCKPWYPFGPTCAGSKLGGWKELGVSWGKLGGWRKLGVSWSMLGGCRELWVSWSKGSELGGRGAYQNWWVHWSLRQHVVETPKCKPQYPFGPTCAQRFGSEGSYLGVSGVSLLTREVVGTPKLAWRGNGDPNKYRNVEMWSHLSGWLMGFAPKFWARGGDLWRPFAAMLMDIGWELYFQVVGTHKHYMW